MSVSVAVKIKNFLLILFGENGGSFVGLPDLPTAVSDSYPASHQKWARGLPAEITMHPKLSSGGDKAVRKYIKIGMNFHTKNTL